MPRETIYYCAAPGCDTNMRSTAPAPPRGWLLVREHDADGELREIDLCSWDCVLKFAGEIEPPTVIPLAG